MVCEYTQVSDSLQPLPTWPSPRSTKRFIGVLSSPAAVREVGRQRGDEESCYTFDFLVPDRWKVQDEYDTIQRKNKKYISVIGME